MKAIIVDDEASHHDEFQAAIFRVGHFHEICSVFDAESAALMLTPLPEDAPKATDEAPQVTKVTDEAPWDLVLLDNIPDGEDGLSLCRLIAALPIKKRPRLVAVTTGSGGARAKMLAILWEAWIKAVASPVTELDPMNLKLLWLPVMLPAPKKSA